MRTIRFLNFAGVALIGIASCFFAMRTHLNAQQSTPVKIKSGRYRRRGLQRQRTRGRRLGDCGNNGPAHALHQGSCHRRSGPLPDSRSAQEPRTASGRAVTD